MAFTASDIKYCDDQAVISLIEGSQTLLKHYGRWPTFIDSEIVECHFLRGNILECSRSDKWESMCPPSLRCIIQTFDERYAHDDAKRKPATVSLLFSGIVDFYMSGFSYQNAICGMGICRVYSNNLKADVFSVAWGGAAMQHDVKFICEAIKVELIESKR